MTTTQQGLTAEDLDALVAGMRQFSRSMEAFAQAAWRAMTPLSFRLSVVYARASYGAALDAERLYQRNVGQFVTRERLRMALTPGLTYADLSERVQVILTSRWACGWTRDEAAEIAAGALRGYCERPEVRRAFATVERVRTLLGT